MLSQPALRANRDRTISQAEQAEFAWLPSVLAAVEDVQSAQSAYLRLRREAAATREAFNSYDRVVTLSREIYNAGTTTLLDLLDAECSRSAAPISLAGAIRDLASNCATLQVAAGRGRQ